LKDVAPIATDRVWYLIPMEFCHRKCHAPYAREEATILFPGMHSTVISAGETGKPRIMKGILRFVPIAAASVTDGKPPDISKNQPIIILSGNYIA